MQRESIAKWLLIAALTFVLGYFGIDKLVHPEFWLGWIPMWMEGLMSMSRNVWLMVIAIAEILMAILLLIPVRNARRIGAAIIAIHLLTIITQVGWNDIGVRDIGLFLSSLALLFLL